VPIGPAGPIAPVVPIGPAGPIAPVGPGFGLNKNSTKVVGIGKIENDISSILFLYTFVSIDFFSI
jgi:hypothetical protein